MPAGASPAGQGVYGTPADGVDGMVPELAVSEPGLGLGVVSVVPVGPTQVFVQAGAFAQFDNANRVRARLSNLGSVKVTSVLVNGRDLFRVRAGPLASVTDADRILKWVIDAGYQDARIVVD